MKRRVLLVLAFIATFLFNVTNIYALETTDIFSNEAIVYNLKTDEVLYSKNTNDGSVQIASLTKLMTYALVIENIDDLENTMIVVPNGIKQSMINEGASTTGLEDNYEYPAIDLLYGLMLPSGCDAADVFAYYISDNDYDKFVIMMNDKAKELGMNDTVFYSASGLTRNGNNNVSTEQDLYKLAKYVINLPYFKKIIGTEFYTVTGNKGEAVDSNTVRNTNYMMGEYNGAEYFYQYSLGGKTGNLSGAGRCLISFATKGDLEVVAITLGVPNQHSNYHLTDHKKLFEYTFETYTDNIEIEIGSLYKSVGIGEKIQIEPITEDTNITWTSSDESIATVNKYGVVTGKRIGQVKITATTSTGNKDFAYVSVGFYNGIDIKYSAGPTDPNGILNYGKLDWNIIKDNGIDFAIIRAGYALNNKPDSDPYFVYNIKSAIEKEVDVMISFDGYASDGSYAEKEAEYLINYLNENIPEYLDDINLPIVYNLYTANITNVSRLTEIINAFNTKMQEAGYSIVVELGRTVYQSLDIEEIVNSDIGLYIVYRPYVPDFETVMSATKGEDVYEADIWQYRSDMYFGATGVAKKIIMSVMYMDYKTIDTNHNKFNEDMYSDKPNNTLDEEYVYTGEEIIPTIKDFDDSKMNITGNKGTNAGDYTIIITPKDKWKDGSKESVEISWEIKKADPIVEAPKLSAKAGTKLSDIKLPENFVWINPDEVLSNDNNMFYITYIPNDTNNYNTKNVFVTIEVLKEKVKEKVEENTKVDIDEEVEEEQIPNTDEETVIKDDNVDKKEPIKYESEDSTNIIWIILGIVIIVLVALGVIKLKSTK